MAKLMVDLPCRSGLPAALYKVLQLYSHQVRSSMKFPAGKVTGVLNGTLWEMNGI